MKQNKGRVGSYRKIVQKIYVPGASRFGSGFSLMSTCAGDVIFALAKRAEQTTRADENVKSFQWYFFLVNINRSGIVLQHAKSHTLPIYLMFPHGRAGLDEW